MSWSDIMGLAALIVGFSSPIIAVILYLHKRRNQHAHEINAKIDKLDSDINGLTTQLAENALDAERRYVNRIDHTASINQLNGTMAHLERTVGELNRHLFEMARGQQ